MAFNSKDVIIGMSYLVSFVIIESVDEVLDDDGLIAIAVVAVLAGDHLGLVEIADSEEQDHQTHHGLGGARSMTSFLNKENDICLLAEEI